MQGKNLFGWAETNVSPLPHHYAGKQFFGWAETNVSSLSMAIGKNWFGF